MPEPTYEALLAQYRGEPAASDEGVVPSAESDLVAELEMCAEFADGTHRGMLVPLADFTRTRIARALRAASAIVQTARLRARSRGAELIVSARLRHLDVHGHTPEGDRGRSDELLQAAGILVDVGQMGRDAWVDRDGLPVPPGGWPWPAADYTPSDNPVENLQIAGSLIAAAMDTLLAEADATRNAPRPVKRRPNFT